VTILKNLYGYLVEQNYLMGNLWSAVGVPRTSGPKVNAGRSFGLAQWQFSEGQVKMLPATSPSRLHQVGIQNWEDRTGRKKMGQRRLEQLRGQRNWPRLRRYGIVKKKVAPCPVAPSAQMWPPWRSMMRCTAARPTPVPSNSFEA
jgi:hypothetical protein